jgi:hypothetical protein
LTLLAHLIVFHQHLFLSILDEQGRIEGKIAQLVVTESPSLEANLYSLAGCRFTHVSGGYPFDPEESSAGKDLNAYSYINMAY